MKRSRVIGSKSAGRVLKSCKCSALPSAAVTIMAAWRADRGLRHDLAGSGSQRRGNGAGRVQGVRRRRLLEVSDSARDAQSGDASIDRGNDGFARARARHRIGGVETMHDLEGQRRVARAAGQAADVIQAGGERRDAGARNSSKGRLETEYPAQGCRHANRAVRIRSQGERHAGSADGRARSAGRPSRRALGIERISYRAVMGILIGEAVGIFVHAQGADENCACVPQTLSAAASCPAGGFSRSIFEPASVTTPVTSKRFFTASGTPPSGPTGVPARRRASTLRAAASASSSKTAV